MAVQHDRSAHVSTKARRYTMGYIRDQRKFQPSPSITLKGVWLDDAGFETGAGKGTAGLSDTDG